MSFIDVWEESKRKMRNEYKCLTSHQLAKILLENDDMTIITHANNHSYSELDSCMTHGGMKVGIVNEYISDEYKRHQCIIIGNFDEFRDPNYLVENLYQNKEEVV